LAPPAGVAGDTPGHYADVVVAPSPSVVLRSLGERLATALDETVAPAAVLLTGSAATGLADRYSDVDLIVYHDVLPADGRIAAFRAVLGDPAFRVLAPRTDDDLLEALELDGVECQVAHTTVAAARREIDGVIVDLDVRSPLQKAIQGLGTGIPLRGAEVIDDLRARCVYTDDVQRAMVLAHARFTPLWYHEPRLETRDASVWIREVLVQTAQDVLGVLAGLNRVWYSSFQLKHTGALCASFALAPDDLSARVDALVLAPLAEAVEVAEALVADVLALVDRSLPGLVAAAARPPGSRASAW
jgi:hypothetical protein